MPVPWAPTSRKKLIERLRTFEKIRTTAGFTAYQDIVDGSMTFDRGGISYTVNVDVTDYWFDEDAVSITDDPDDLPDPVGTQRFPISRPWTLE